MWKKLNKILKDKDEFYLDPEIKNEIERTNQLFIASIDAQKALFIKKVKYLLKNNKYFFVRLLFKYLLKSAIFLFVFLILSMILLMSFGVDINFKKIPKVEHDNLVIYIPSTGDIEKDSLTLAQYKKEYGKNVQYSIFYLKDPSKNYNKWKEALAGIESNGSYHARRPGSQYWGKYQLGEDARKSIHLNNVTWDEWKNNGELQEAALRMWIEVVYQSIKYDIDTYDGKFLSGWYITESGLIAMAHNVGPGPVKQFLNSNGRFVPKDGSGKDATRFLILGNYNLELKK